MSIEYHKDQCLLNLSNYENVPKEIFLNSEFINFCFRHRRFRESIRTCLPSYVCSNIDFFLNFHKQYEYATFIISSCVISCLDDSLLDYIDDTLYAQMKEYISDKLFFVPRIIQCDLHICDSEDNIMYVKKLESIRFDYGTYIKEFKYAHRADSIVKRNYENGITILTRMKSDIIQRSNIQHMSNVNDVAIKF